MGPLGTLKLLLLLTSIVLAATTEPGMSHSKNMIEHVSKWTTKFNTKGLKSHLLPWKDSFIRVCDEDIQKDESGKETFVKSPFFYFETMTPEYGRPVYCKIPKHGKMNLEWGMSLENGKVVLYLTDSLMIVDPSKCTSEWFQLSEPRGKIIIVDKHYSFDLLSHKSYFYSPDKSMKVCNGYERFHQMDDMESLENHNTKKDYMHYEVINEDSRSKVRFYNWSHEVVMEHSFEHRIDAVAFEHGYRTVCHQIEQNGVWMLECKLMDSEFKMKAKTSFKLPAKINREDADRDLSVHNTMGGSVLVFYKDTSVQDASHGVMMYRRIAADGKLMDDQDRMFMDIKDEYHTSSLRMYSYEASSDVFCGMMMFTTKMHGMCVNTAAMQ